MLKIDFTLLEGKRIDLYFVSKSTAVMLSHSPYSYILLLTSSVLHHPSYFLHHSMFTVVLPETSPSLPPPKTLPSTSVLPFKVTMVLAVVE